jgi:tetratricopeptide (TPR) repeat protein
MTATTASAKELWERPWIEVRSPHFVIVSAIPKGVTIDLARDLECFREAVQIVTDVGHFDERIPTKVYVLPQPVVELGFKRHTGGYFIPGMRANYAGVVQLPLGNVNNMLKHEYVHFIVHNDESKYPKWFDEGFAEVLSTMSARGKAIEYGEPMPERVARLPHGKWIPFAQLLEIRDVFSLEGDQTAMFYAQSWLLVHYLMNARPERKLKTDVAEYLRLEETGTSPSAAFERAFGVPVSQLRDTLYRYLVRDLRVAHVSLENALPEARVEVVPVSADAIAAQLALLLWYLDEFDEAKRYWTAAIALNPSNALAFVGLGNLERSAGRFAEAQAHYEEALSLEPQNAYVELDYAEYFLDRALVERQQGVNVADYLIEARRHFARSYKLDPNNPETLAMNGLSHLRSGEFEKALDSLVAAHEMLPSQPRIQFLLAQAYLMSGNPDAAEPLLRSLVAWDHAGIANEATKLLVQVAKAKTASDNVVPPAGDEN